MKVMILQAREIAQKIYFVRGHRVMLDSDLAELYEVETKNLNKAVRRNLARFPDDFMFQLTESEYECLRFQIGTLKNTRGAHRKYMPLVFTEQGVAMLSSVLNGNRATQVNIAIVRTFVKLREMLETNKELAQKIEQLERRFLAHDEQFKAVFDAIRKLVAAGTSRPQKRIKGLNE